MCNYMSIESPLGAYKGHKKSRMDRLNGAWITSFVPYVHGNNDANYDDKEGSI
jgi:hypothetical protein